MLMIGVPEGEGKTGKAHGRTLMMTENSQNLHRQSKSHREPKYIRLLDSIFGIKKTMVRL